MWEKPNPELKDRPLDLGRVSPDIRRMYLRLYARFGRYSDSIRVIAPPHYQELAEKARKFYLDHIEPLEDRAVATENGLIPPPDADPIPTFSPFIRESKSSLLGLELRSNGGRKTSSPSDEDQLLSMLSIESDEFLHP